MDLLIGIIIILIGIYLFRYSIQKQNSKDSSDELFPTDRFTEKENIKSAKCPQCGKTANTYNEVKNLFGLRKVGYATDIQSWCRECRRNKEEIKKKKSKDKDLSLFDE